jgi:hypothetical protein
MRLVYSTEENIHSLDSVKGMETGADWLLVEVSRDLLAIIAEGEVRVFEKDGIQEALLERV